MSIVGSNMDQRILSAPHEVYWAGFRSTTTEMQQNGWKLAVEFEPYRLMYRLMFTHEMMRLYALTAQEHIESGAHGFGTMHGCVPFRVCYAAASFETLRINTDLSNFRAIDAVPQMVNTKITKVEDLNIFNVSLKRTEEILVDAADMSVIEHLEAIKAMQSEEQKIIRERMLRGVQPGELTPDVLPESHVIANVIAIGASR